MRDETTDYWDLERETRDPTERDRLVLGQLQRQLRRVYAELPFYGRHWDAHGFHPDQVGTLRDFTERCPIITKKMLVADQAEHPPYGSYLGVDRRDVSRIHGSSGTSGTPTMYGVSKRDWDNSREIWSIAHWSMGLRPSDTVHFAFPFGLFFGGWGVLYAAESVGATCLPAGATDTRTHLELIEKMGCTFLEATPSYMLHMADVGRKVGYDVATSPVRRAMVGGEPGGSIPSTRARIMEAWGLQSLCDSGTSSEMFPFCTSTECTHMNGLHLYQDEIWTEIVDTTDPNRPMPEGGVGNVVYTHLWRESQPMIRFSVGDRSFMSTEPCPCGRTYPRLPAGLLGRTDDVLVIRGANVYPSAIEHALREVAGIGLEFRIRVSRTGTMDEIAVQAELDEHAVRDGADRREITRQAGEALKRHCLIRIPVELVEPATFERATLKAKRVIDERALQVTS
jgi:phenylacetate-CoA ligase